MFSTSQDVLYLVLSVCIALVTVFLFWFFFYLIALLRKANKTMDSVTEKIQFVHHLFEKGFGHLGFAVEALKMVMATVLNQKTKTKSKK
jgi:hypothetical protein